MDKSVFLIITMTALILSSMCYMICKLLYLRIYSKLSLIDSKIYDMIVNFYPNAIIKNLYTYENYQYLKAYLKQYHDLCDNKTPAWIPLIHWLVLQTEELLIIDNKKFINKYQNTNEVLYQRKILYCKYITHINNKSTLHLIDVANNLNTAVEKIYISESIYMKQEEIEALIGRILIVEFVESINWDIPIRLIYIENTPFFFNGATDMQKKIRRIWPQYTCTFEAMIQKLKHKRKRTVHDTDPEFWLYKSVFELWEVEPY